MNEKQTVATTLTLSYHRVKRYISRVLFGFGFCCAVTSIAQGQKLEGWGVSRSILPSDNGEVATSVLELEDGGLLIAGYEYHGTGGEWNALVLRVDAAGRVVWRRSSGLAGNDYAWVVRKSRENRFIVVGTRVTAAGDAAGYMECIDGDGRTIWLRTYGGSKSEVLWAAKQTDDGGFMLVGQTDSEGAGGLDFYVVRTDSNGHELWVKTFGGPTTDRAFGIDFSPDGGALVVGFQGDNPQAMNFLILRIDSEGREVWRWALAGDRFDVAHGVVSAFGDGFVVSGYSSSFGPGDQDGFLMRLAGDGRMSWMKTYGDATDDRILHVAAVTDGFALVGYSRHESVEIWDMVVRIVDRQGDLLWSYRVPGSVGKDIIAGREGSLIAVGSIRTSMTSNDDILILRILPKPQ